MRMMLLVTGVAGLLAGAPSAAAPAQLAAKAAAEAPIPDNALRLSMLLNPADKTIEVAMRGFRFGIDAGLKKNPDDAAVYDRNPGLIDAVADAGAAVTRRHLVATMPARQRRFAELFARKFSASEIDDLVAFYSTPTGTKVITAMYAGLDIGKLVEGMDVKDDAKVTAASIQEANKAATSRLPDLFDADDWKSIFVFATTPASAKLTTIAPEVQQLAADIENEPDPAFDAEMNEAVTAAVKAYMAKKTSKTAS